MSAQKYNVELTDTFSGEANYAWIKRAVVYAAAADTDTTLMRRAKKAVGMNGIRGITSPMGEGFEFRPYGMCQVMFVTPEN